MGSNLSIEFVAQDNHIFELIRYRVLFRITAVPDLGLVKETEARSLNDPGRSAEGIGSEENSCPENSLEGGYQTPIFLAAFVHPERLQHLGRSSKANGLTLLADSKSRQVNRHDTVLSEREAILGVTSDLQHEVAVPALVQQQTILVFPSWTSRVRSPSPAPCFQ